MDIVAWLTDLGLERYAEQFAANEIDEKILRDLSGEDLKELGVSALGHRKKLLLAIAELGKFGSEAGPTAAADTLDGARRQVTVLFADISGFTQLSNELGAEATHDLLSVISASLTESSRGMVARSTSTLAITSWRFSVHRQPIMTIPSVL